MTESSSLYQMIIDEKNKGNICFFVSPDEIAKANLDEFVKQPSDGILYDLNRDEMTALAFIKGGDIKWVNNYAVALVVRKLKEIIDERL